MNNAASFIKSKLEDLNLTPEIGLVLGSGLGDLANEIKGISINYSEIPGFESSGVKGHAGKLVIGNLCSKTIMAMQGRFHYYEGYPMSKVVFPIRVMKRLGINTLIVTNAAGGINLNFKPGDLMIICDHLNLMGTNPLIGKNFDDLGSRFCDMTFAYDKSLINLTEKLAENLDINLQKGVYAGLTGPCYETCAEVRMLRILGADAVGMSTVPEVIVANHMSMKVLGISCITNAAAGILDRTLNHEEVIETTTKVKHNFIKLVKSVIENMKT